MAEESEVEELQLQLESKICSIDLNGLVELAAHLKVESKELRKLALSKSNALSIELNKRLLLLKDSRRSRK